MSVKLPLTIEELRRTQEYAALTPKMKVYIETYISSCGDSIAATHRAYDCNTKREEMIFAWALKRHPKILACIDIWSQKDPKEIWMESIKAATREGRPSVQRVSLLRMQGEAQGWIQPTGKIKAETQKKNATIRLKREARLAKAQEKKEEKQKEKEKPEPEAYDLSSFENQAPARENPVLRQDEDS